MSVQPFPIDDLLSALKAAGEATRLRLLALLAHGDLNVKDLTRILAQSQPRISRHLKLLADSELIERHREGSWAFYRLADRGRAGRLAARLVQSIDPADPVIARDLARLEDVKTERAQMAQSYFEAHAAEWDTIRALHISEAQVEAAMAEVLPSGPFDLFIDLGTGTGRILELFAPRFRRGLGLDINRGMLAYARGKLDRAGLQHCHVRQGDLYNPPVDDGCADVVVLHQVLHFLSAPDRAIREAARILAPGGHLLIVDFAPHDLDFLREAHAHQRLGFDDATMARWIEAAGLSLTVSRDLDPEGSSAGKREPAKQLTVSLWLAGKPGPSTVSKATGGRKRRSLEQVS